MPRRCYSALLYMEEKYMLCIYYCEPGMRNIDKAQQVKIDFRPQDDTLEEFIRRNQEKTIYIQAEAPLDNYQIFQNLKKYGNWVLQFPVKYIFKTENGVDKIDEVKFNAIKDCCDKYMFTDLVGQWEVLQFVLSLKPCEVYVTNILCFSINKLIKVCSDAEVGIRLYANWAQAAWDGIPAIKKFFIRPEDVDLYDEYNISIEFKGDGKIQDIVYDVYERGYWYGDLSEIILGLTDVLDDRRVPRDFGVLRLNCGKRCVQGDSCNVCHALQKFAQTLEKTDTMIKRD